MLTIPHHQRQHLAWGSLTRYPLYLDFAILLLSLLSLILSITLCVLASSCAITSSACTDQSTTYTSLIYSGSVPAASIILATAHIITWYRRCLMPLHAVIAGSVMAVAWLVILFIWVGYERLAQDIGDYDGISISSMAIARFALGIVVLVCYLVQTHVAAAAVYTNRVAKSRWEGMNAGLRASTQEGRASVSPEMYCSGAILTPRMLESMEDEGD